MEADAGFSTPDAAQAALLGGGVEHRISKTGSVYAATMRWLTKSIVAN